jgi:hypothetical protein
VNGRVLALAAFAAGPGEPEQLIVGGRFSSSGGAQTLRIAAWNGERLLQLGLGVSDGSPPSATGVHALAVYDADGPGPHPAALYLAGNFSRAGGIPARNIARWDGARFEPLAEGLNAPANALLVHDDDGVGPRPATLVAGGAFSAAGRVACSRVARYDGAAWSPLHSGVPGDVFALAAYADEFSPQGGMSLIVGGRFFTVNDEVAGNLARWDGEAWTTLGIGVDGGRSDVEASVYALAVHDDDGAGPGAAALYVAGRFVRAGGNLIRNNAARWDGHWSPFGRHGVSGAARALASFGTTSADPAALWIGGEFGDAIQRWDGRERAVPGAGVSFGQVNAATAFRGGSAEPPDGLLVIGGQFEHADGAYVTGLAQRDGGVWRALGELTGGAPLTEIRAMQRFDPDGAGPAAEQLVVTGAFAEIDGHTCNAIAAWDGSAWSALSAGLTGGALTGGRALAVFDDDGDGPQPAALFVGGDFAGAGAAAAAHIARWDGRNWSAVGGGMNGPVAALVEFDADGDGPDAPALFAGGGFSQAGGRPAPYIARWDGVAWMALPQPGPNYSVMSLAVHDADGPEPAPPRLIVGGAFVLAGGQTVNRIAQFDGVEWSPLGAGFDSDVVALASFDEDGTGPLPPALYAGGWFTRSGNAPVQHIARWDGADWTPVGAGAGFAVTALAELEHGAGDWHEPSLLVGGRFLSAGGASAQRLTRLVGCDPSLVRGDLNCDGLVNNLDVDPFVLLLTNPDAYEQQHPRCAPVRGDINHDGRVDNFDIDGFVALLRP